MLYKVCKVILFFALSWHECLGAKILAVFPTASKSHWILAQPLMKELARSGHEVTVMSPFPLKNPPKNYRNIEIKTTLSIFSKKIDEFFDEVDINPLFKIKEMFEMSNDVVNRTLREPAVVELLKSKETFDLLFLEIFLDDALLGLAHHYKCPVVAMSTMGATKWVNELTGSPNPLSYVPHMMLDMSDRMTFWQRLGNMVFTAFEELLMKLFFYGEQSKIYDEYFANPKPTLDELKKTAVSVVLLNSHFSLSFPRPYLPSMIEVGGMQIEHNPVPLPDDLKQFVESAEHGVIYFSMGGNLKPSKMPLDKRQFILNGLSARKEKIILKWDDEESSKSLDREKFFISDWLPQADILAHPNTKVFVTHGGLLGSTEAVNYGVPVVGIPIFGDQRLNMARAQTAGWGIRVDYTNLTDASFGWALKEILENPRYKNNMKKVSKRYHDQPLPPLQLAKFWVEYVLRNDGADHIKSSALKLSFIEYHSLDLIGFLLVTVLSVLALLMFIVYKICCCYSKKPIKQKYN